MKLRVLVACEFTGTVRRAFRALGHDAWSCDLEPAEDGSEHHIRGDVRSVLGGLPPQFASNDSCGIFRTRDGGPWDLMVAHPVCTRLTNAGVRWLKVPPPGRTLEEMWVEFREGMDLYEAIRKAPIKCKAIENPVMHLYARVLLRMGERQTVQPWWFGDPFFKATGWELVNLPPLVATNRLTPPKKGTPEHKKWSAVHMASPGENRGKDRSRFYPGMAAAIAEQWGGRIALAEAA